MKLTLILITVRHLWKHLGRFIAMSCIVLLGSACFAGVSITGPDMRLTAQAYYSEHNLSDIRLVSTYGFTNEDIDLLRTVNQLSAVSAGYRADVLADLPESTPIVRLLSFDLSAETINRPNLLEGRLPEKAGEATVDEKFMEYNNCRLGDTVPLFSGTGDPISDILNTDSVLLVGVARNPLYTMPLYRGNTNIGKGVVDAFFLLHPSSFNMEVYTEIYACINNPEGLSRFDPNYADHISPVKKSLEEMGEIRAPLRRKDFISKAQNKIDEAWDEINEAEYKLDDAAQKIAEAEKELADYEADYCDGETEYNDKIFTAQKELKEAESELLDANKELSDSEQELLDGEDKILSAWAELDDARIQAKGLQKQLDDSYTQALEEYAQSRAKLDELNTQIKVGENELRTQSNTLAAGNIAFEQGKREYEEGLAKYRKNFADFENERISGKASLEAALAKLNEARLLLGNLAPINEEAARELALYEAEYATAEMGYNAKIAAAQKQLEQAERELVAANYELAATEQKLKEGAAKSQEASIQLNDAKKQAEDSKKLLEEFQKQIDEEFAQKRNELDEAFEQIKEGEDEWRKQNNKLASGNADLRKGKKDYEEGLTEYKNILNNFENERDKGKSTLNKARSELNEAELKLVDARTEYKAQFEENEPKLLSARADLADAEKILAELPEPKWYAMDLFDNESFAAYKENCSRIAAVSTVFPVVFFLVAALVSLTAMTRIVEDDRIQIGLLKALGYAKRQIVSKYVIFAVLATAMGLALGLNLGFNLLPHLITRSYAELFRFPPLITISDISYSLLSIMLSLLCTLGPALFVCLRSLDERPAQLMQAKAPLPGRRIILEYIPFVWRRLNFLQKVTARNIFRFAKRLSMTLCGIAGCAALMFTGFGLDKSVKSVVANQFENVIVFDCAGQLSITAMDSQREDAIQLFKGLTIASLPIQQKSVEVDIDGVTRSIQLNCPLELESLDNFIKLRDKTTQTPLELPDDGLILTDKAARVLGLEVGDELRIRVDEGRFASLPIMALTENYAEHYIYVSPTAYATLFGEEAVISALYGNLPLDTDKEALATKMLSSEGMMNFFYMDDFRNSFADKVDVMSFVVFILIISAAALAFVVLFSLSDINVEERRREIATIKVLGFFEREVARYINRETLLLSMFGAAIGLLFGVWLLQFVITNSEVEMLVFSRETPLSSFLWSYLTTIAFTLIVNWIMGFRLHRIDMVESLKSVE
jgi:putative ABC transport system permease protein